MILLMKLRLGGVGENSLIKIKMIRKMDYWIRSLVKDKIRISRSILEMYRWHSRKKRFNVVLNFENIIF